jgi:hypothetical protein
MGLALTAALTAALLVPAAAAAAPPQVAGCQVFPASSVWNKPVGAFPKHKRSAKIVKAIGAGKSLHADFGSGEWDGGPIGIPITVVDSSQPTSSVDFLYDDESDPGPYPIPSDVAIEGGPGADGDRHAIIVERDSCTLYELFDLWPAPWEAGSGAIWDLESNALRPRGWTSADAAGLPILPGLARYDEVASGAIKHALRFTVERSRRAYIYPARHFASSSTNRNLPPMGLRLRLRSSFRVSSFPYQARVILRALKRYGMIVADNGSSWYVSGAPDERWNNDQLHTLHRVKGSDFRVVDTSKLRP